MWGEIKKAINSTTGAGMLPLDRIIEESNEELLYNLMADKYGIGNNTEQKVCVCPRVERAELGTTSILNIIERVYFSPETKTIGFLSASPTFVQELYIPMVEHITGSAFVGFTGLKRVILGSSLLYIGTGSFSASELTVFFKGTKSQWDSVERVGSWNRGGVSKIVCYDQTFNE